MHLQPNRNYISNDDVQTPSGLARQLVAHFQPAGRILEPCAGDGNFLRALRSFVRQRADHSSRNALGRTRVSAVKFRGSSSSVPRTDWCGLKRGRDFFAWERQVDWIVTNPPWSQFRPFLQHAMAVAEHVVFVVTINHLWTRARLRDIREAGFGVREIVLLDTPPSFPPLGFQLGAVHLSRGRSEAIALSDLRGSGKL